MSNNDVLLDIIYMKKKTNELYIQELNNSLKYDAENSFFYKHDIKLKMDELEFLNELKAGVSVSNNGVEYLRKMLALNNPNNSFYLLRFNKYDIIKQVLKDYKNEYKRNYWNNKIVGVKGVFDNKLFCDVIKKRINKYTNCNKVTKKKYTHLVAFLNELLHEMENSSNPIETLKQKMNLYKRYKKTEFVCVRLEKFTKIDVIKDILNEYNEKKTALR